MSNARFAILQSRAVRDTRISDAQFRTLAALGMYADEEGWCFPSLTTIGKDLGKSKQAVGRDILALRDLGYVESQARFAANGSRRSNLYRLRFDLPPRQREVDAPSTSEVDAPSTSEVDVNDPINDPQEQATTTTGAAEISSETVYEAEIGPTTPIVRWVLERACRDYGEQDVVDAIREASLNNKRNWAYCAAILARWAREGRGSPAKPPPGQGRTRGPSNSEPNPEAAIQEYLHGRDRATARA